MLGAFAHLTGGANVYKESSLLVPYEWDVRRIDVFWLSKKQRVGWINELKVGSINMSKDQVWKQLPDDYRLMEAGRAKMLSDPYRGKYVPINIDIWWFMPNPAGVMKVSAPVQTALEMLGINDIQVSQVYPFPPPPKKRKAKKTADQIVKQLESGDQGEVQDAVDLLFVPTGPICAP